MTLRASRSGVGVGTVTVSSGGVLTGVNAGTASVGAGDSSEPVFMAACGFNSNPCPIAFGVGGNASGSVQPSGIPTSETTACVGTVGITEGGFQMTLHPDIYTYDNHYVEENSPAPGTNTCWWLALDKNEGSVKDKLLLSVF